MALKPEVSLPVALATGTVVWTIYNQGLPGRADISVGQPGDDTIEQVRKQNAWVAASVVGGISLIARDPTVFIVGGAMVVALDWLTRYANFRNPLTGRVDLNPFTVESPSEMGAAASTGEVNYGDLAAVS